MFCILKALRNLFNNDFKSPGHKVGKDTLYLYLTYLKDAFLIYAVPIFIAEDTKKIYAIDNGLAVANTINLSANLGRLFENQVYLDLRRPPYSCCMRGTET